MDVTKKEEDTNGNSQNEGNDEANGNPNTSPRVEANEKEIMEVSFSLESNGNNQLEPNGNQFSPFIEETQGPSGSNMKREANGNKNYPVIDVAQGPSGANGSAEANGNSSGNGSNASGANGGAKDGDKSEKVEGNGAVVEDKTDYRQLFEDILRRYEKDDSIQVASATLSPAVGKGQNFMSIASRVLVKGKRKKNKHHKDFSITIFMKRQFESQSLKKTFQSKKVFENEALAYNTIVPAMEEYSISKMPLPKCYLADADQTILEDLNDSGYHMYLERKSLGIDEAIAVLKELALFHSGSIVLRKKNPAKFKRCKDQVNEFITADNEPIRKMTNINVLSTIMILQSLEQTKQILEAIDKVKTFQQDLYTKVCDLLQVQRETDVFNHGDCWMNNILFRNKMGDISVKLVDLQVMRCSSIAADLSYFLFINLHPAERRKSYTDLLEFYLSCLHSHLKANGLLEEIKLYNMEFLLEEMEKYAILGFMFGLWIMPVLYMDKEKLVAMEHLSLEDLSSPEQQRRFMANIPMECRKTLFLFVSYFFEDSNL